MQLELKGIKRDFVSRNGCQHRCIEGMNLVISSGEFHLLYGASGSGKTTLLNMMAGMLRPSEGQILLDGEEIQNKGEQELARLRRKTFGYAMQNASLLSSLTVYENVVLPLSFFAKEEEEAAKALQKAGLWRVRDSYPSELSGGEYRRCTILRALIMKPKFLFADEPTSNLDDENARVIMEMLEGLRKEGAAVVVATHDKRFIEDTRRVHCLDSAPSM
ncbi:MAG: ABC transporter ATP-binding protein [Lachnospiraceae bacterium]